MSTTYVLQHTECPSREAREDGDDVPSTCDQHAIVCVSAALPPIKAALRKDVENRFFNCPSREEYSYDIRGRAATVPWDEFYVGGDRTPAALEAAVAAFRAGDPSADAVFSAPWEPWGPAGCRNIRPECQWQARCRELLAASSFAGFDGSQYHTASEAAPLAAPATVVEIGRGLIRRSHGDGSEIVTDYVLDNCDEHGSYHNYKISAFAV